MFTHSFIKYLFKITCVKLSVRYKDKTETVCHGKLLQTSWGFAICNHNTNIERDILRETQKENQRGLEDTEVCSGKGSSNQHIKDAQYLYMWKLGMGIGRGNSRRE